MGLWMVSVSTERMHADAASNAVEGRVVWMARKSIWTFSMMLAAIVAGPMTVSWDAIALFAGLSAVTLCLGHSVGMHRLLIHRSFVTPLWLEHCLVYLGTLVGMAGPFGMIYAHDIRDWAQRQRACHDLFAHRRSFFRDAFWQMHCAVDLRDPPRLVVEERVSKDRFYRFLETTWMWQQLPLAIILFTLGGWSWVVWGIPVRITVSLIGHWVVGHFAHRGGHQGWSVDNVAVQGYNLRRFGLITFGESFHGNHHAFPHSARMGLASHESDPGWWCIKLLERHGLASGIKLPDTMPHREGLRPVVRP